MSDCGFDYHDIPLERAEVLVAVAKLRAELARRDEQKQMDESNHEYEIHRRDDIISRLKEDAERLAKRSLYWDDWANELVCTHECSEEDNADAFIHAPDCPITLHRALMKEIGGEK